MEKIKNYGGLYFNNNNNGTSHCEAAKPAAAATI